MRDQLMGIIKPIAISLLIIGAGFLLAGIALLIPIPFMFDQAYTSSFDSVGTLVSAILGLGMMLVGIGFSIAGRVLYSIKPESTSTPRERGVARA